MAKNNRIRILYLVSRLQKHGPIFQLYNIIKHLDRQKFCPKIISLSPEAPKSMLQDFRSLDVEYDSLELSRVAGMILGPRKIRELLNKNPADLVHVFDYRSTLLCANHLGCMSRLVTCRQSYRHVFGPILGKFMMSSFLAACGKCECVVAVSNSIRKLISDRVDRRIDVVHNGIDLDKFKPPDEDDKKRLRSRLGLPTDRRVLLSAGFLSKNKGLPTLMEAFVNSPDNCSDTLILLGDGPLRGECFRLAAAKDNIHVPGFVENVQDYLRAADVFVSASLTEGCPNAVMEAMACGLPVILSDIPPHREILAFNEKAGLLFNVGDTVSLSKALSKSRAMNPGECSSAALGIIANHLNAEIMSSRYQQLYAKLKEQTG